ncbi:hypothetical protein K402DRAFT_423271 [Aulographum hederae CBS 113979]|uniref:BTB domain-containing protein n=1 Tax=Aulographum hederae CBS 113979 TaxID=1176131 RepID=A0A6G1GT13_9PEZI|nr:hypothetical protein K402DRAFT_423271 [Aulographum hederae CBS 113979]
MKRVCRDAASGPKVGGRIIKVRVGKGGSKETFNVYEDLIRESSTFFENALNRKWKESRDRLISIPSHSPDVFAVYLKWLVSGMLFISNSEEVLPAEDGSTTSKRRILPAEDESTTSKRRVQEDSLIAAFSFSDYIQDDDFKDCVIDGIVEHLKTWNVCHHMFPVEIWRLSQGGCPAASLALAMILDFRIFSHDQDFSAEFREAIEPYPELIYNAACALSSELEWDKGERIKYTVVSSCRYHQHQITKAPCYKERFGIE